MAIATPYLHSFTNTFLLQASDLPALFYCTLVVSVLVEEESLVFTPEVSVCC